MKIKVAVFDDNSSRRKSLSVLINLQPDMQCVGTFESCANAVKNVKESAAQVVMLDINMPEISGIEAVIKLRKEFPELYIIMQTVFEDDDKILRSIMAGANGYILKKSHPDKIISGIKEVCDGGSPLTPSVAKRVLELFQKQNSYNFTYSNKSPEFSKLTQKEKEVLNCLVEGLSYKMIAGNLEISVYTVNAHVRKIYKKLQVHSVSGAISKAIHFNILD